MLYGCLWFGFGVVWLCVSSWIGGVIAYIHGMLWVVVLVCVDCCLWLQRLFGVWLLCGYGVWFWVFFQLGSVGGCG